MSEARIEFSIGAISFVGEGDQDWVAAQLDKILDKAPDLVKLTPKKRRLNLEAQPCRNIHLWSQMVILPQKHYQVF